MYKVPAGLSSSARWCGHPSASPTTAGRNRWPRLSPKRLGGRRAGRSTPRPRAPRPSGLRSSRPAWSRAACGPAGRAPGGRVGGFGDPAWIAPSVWSCWQPWAWGTRWSHPATANCCISVTAVVRELRSEVHRRQPGAGQGQKAERRAPPRRATRAPPGAPRRVASARTRPRREWSWRRRHPVGNSHPASRKRFSTLGPVPCWMPTEAGSTPRRRRSPGVQVQTGTSGPRPEKTPNSPVRVSPAVSGGTPGRRLIQPAWCGQACPSGPARRRPVRAETRSARAQGTPRLSSAVSL